MKKQTNKTNWWIDAILFIGFVLAFWLDLTGLSLHQWGGLFLCILALYHLLRHWKWVLNMLQRFFAPKMGGQRVRFLLDFLLMCALEFILLTGLLISSWFDLPLENYLLVRDIHVISSIFSLVLLVVKIALHARWITNTSSNIFPRKTLPKSTGVFPEGISEKQQMERRQVLRLMGTVGVASFAAILVGGSNTFRSILSEQRSAAKTTPTEGTDIPTEQATATQTPTEPTTAQLEEPQVHTSQRRKRGQEVSTVTSTPTQGATPQATQTIPSATSTSSPANCVVRCPKGCAYPGSCRRYVDANFNNLCDLGECL
ncbi:MAG TPA: hypothetical protein DCK95_05045 [Anaerolineaceae bacterium]|nr:hypothetical protein [Anaerolineaceae bacterium]